MIPINENNLQTINSTFLIKMKIVLVQNSLGISNVRSDDVYIERGISCSFPSYDTHMLLELQT